MPTERTYLYELERKPKFLPKHFRTTDEGNYAGYRIRRIQSTHAGVSPQYRNAIMVEKQGEAPTVVYGSEQRINALSSQIHNDPDKVFRSIRAPKNLPGNHFYLGSPPSTPPETQLEDMTEAQINHAKAADRLYPEQGKDKWPLSYQQEERQSLDQEAERVLSDREMYPSSKDGGDRIAEGLLRVKKASSYLDGGE